LPYLSTKAPPELCVSPLLDHPNSQTGALNQVTLLKCLQDILIDKQMKYRLDKWTVRATEYCPLLSTGEAHLEYWHQCWASQYRRDRDIL